MKTKVINLEVSYGQLTIFVNALDHPFNDWSDKHFEQGFAWRPGSVSFRSLIEAGPHSVEIDVRNQFGEIDPDAIRAFEVPFETPIDGAIEVASISHSIPILLPPGITMLRCEFLQAGPDGERVRLTFTKDIPRFAIVRADSELTYGRDLLTTAVPALG